MLTTSNLVWKGERGNRGKMGVSWGRADQRPVTDNGTRVPESQTLTTMTVANKNENDSDSNNNDYDNDRVI